MRQHWSRQAQQTHYTSVLKQNERKEVAAAPAEVEEQAPGYDLAVRRKPFSHGEMEISGRQTAVRELLELERDLWRVGAVMSDIAKDRVAGIQDFDGYVRDSNS